MNDEQSNPENDDQQLPESSDALEPVDLPAPPEPPEPPAPPAPVNPADLIELPDLAEPVPPVEPADLAEVAELAEVEEVVEIEVTVTTSPAPVLTVAQVGSSLQVRGWDKDDVVANGGSIPVEMGSDGACHVQSNTDLKLRVPYPAVLEAHHIGSDARITNMAGTVTLDNVGSDLVLRDVGAVTARNIGSDLRIKSVTGDVRITHVGSDATIREVDGAVVLGMVGSDLYLKDIGGSCHVDRVGADLVLSTDFNAGDDYTFTVGGDIVARIPPDADVCFRIMRCSDLVVDALEAEIIEGDDFDEVIFGDGTAQVDLNAGGEIRLVAQAEDYMMALNVQLEEELASRLNSIEARLADQLVGLDDVLLNKAEQLREKAERQSERAIRQTEKALRKAERKTRQTKRQFSFTLGLNDQARPKSKRRASTPEPREPVTDVERLMILRMVEGGQISVEEAEKLLSALEGR